MALSKKDILSADDRKYELVDVPEWGGQVRIKSLSIAQQIEFDKIHKSGEDEDLILSMVLLSCCDDNGNRLFEESDKEALKEKDSDGVLKVFKAAFKLNSVKDDEIKEQAKN